MISEDVIQEAVRRLVDAASPGTAMCEAEMLGFHAQGMLTQLESWVQVAVEELS